MNVICNSCDGKFTIPDDKIAAGKTATLTCPKCKSKISVRSPKKPGKTEPDEPEKSFSFEEDSDDIYAPSDKPFDFVEEEGKTAMVCESNPSLRKKFIEILEFMEYHITIVKNGRDAIKKMRYQSFDLILVNESFDSSNPDTSGVLIYLERLHMSERRNIIVILVTKRLRTMDTMFTLNKSVDLIINEKDVANADKIFRRGVSDNAMFYRIFKESLKEVGRV